MDDIQYDEDLNKISGSYLSWFSFNNTNKPFCDKNINNWNVNRAKESIGILNNEYTDKNIWLKNDKGKPWVLQKNKHSGRIPTLPKAISCPKKKSERDLEQEQQQNQQYQQEQREQEQRQKEYQDQQLKEQERLRKEQEDQERLRKEQEEQERQGLSGNAKNNDPTMPTFTVGSPTTIS